MPVLALALVFQLVEAGLACAQATAPPTSPASSAPAGNAPAAPASLAPASAQPSRTASLLLGATFASDNQIIRSGLRWRVYAAGSNELVKTSDEAIPVFELEPGDYLVHATYGLASANRRITLPPQGKSERLAIAAGGLSVRGTNGGTPIPAPDIHIAVYIPSPTNEEDKLVADDVGAGEVLRLPEGVYHVVTGYGSSNSTVSADIKVETGKVVEAVVNHKAALITLKLVSQAGSEAIANTAWTVLTPGGDVIREELSAFPSMVLAEGTYTAIARNDGKTFTGDFKVSGTQPQEVEILRSDVQRPDGATDVQRPVARPLTPRNLGNRNAFPK